MKIVKEEINFERGQDPKKAMKVGHSSMSKEKLVENALLDLYHEYAKYQEYDKFGKWLAELMKEFFTAASTHGDYPVRAAQADYDAFNFGWNRIIRTIDENR